jgi:ATP-binding protein involved in chromosome partitioning
MRSKMINQFLANVSWGELDYLIADLPPGTGDEILTIAQNMKPDCAVIVTTPQEVSVMDAERAINMAKTLEIPCIGVIENMSGFICPKCKTKTYLFGSGGGERLASRNNVNFFGSIPIDPDVPVLSDGGVLITLDKRDSVVSVSFQSIMRSIESILNKVPV